MATRIAARRRINRDRLFFGGMAAALAISVFAGFAPTYYLMRLSGATQLPLLTHMHGALFTSWILLFIAQTSLVSAGRTDIHRLLGPAAVVIGSGMVVLGITLAIVSARARAHGVAFDPRTFLIFPFFSIGSFAAFLAFGLAARKRPDFHKRLMLLATISVAVPALARIATMIQPAPVPPGPIGGMVLSDLFLLALIAYDLATRNKLHPATLWGGALLLVSEPLRVLIGHSAPWHAIAKLVIG